MKALRRITIALLAAAPVAAQGVVPTAPDGRRGLGVESKLSDVLSVVRGKDERSLHLSPILQQIKDDGPALIDGEVLKEGAAAFVNELKYGTENQVVIMGR